MSITLDGVVLPDQLQWADEFDFAPVEQSITPTLTGGAIIEETQLQSGRPITLRSNGGVWAPRSKVEQLKAMEAQVQTEGIELLLHDGRSFTVMFRRDPVAVTAREVTRQVNPGPDHLYEIDILLIEVST